MSEAQCIGYTDAQSARISYATPVVHVRMLLLLIRFKSPYTALVSRNLTEQITIFSKDQFLQYEVTGKYTHRLQSYNNSVMPEIKYVSLQLQCIDTMSHD